MSIPDYAEEAAKALGKACPTMRKAIKKVGPFTMPVNPPKSPFLGLMRAIIFQQLSGKAANTIHGRLVDLFPSKSQVTAVNLLKLDVDTLRTAGVSRNKALALHDLAAKTVDGVVPTFAKLRKLEDDEIIERLTQVRGIGRWTVEMLLMFSLGRPDVMPVDDLGVRKGYALAAGLEEMPKPKELLAIAEKWRPWRSVASWYCWQMVDQAGA